MRPDQSREPTDNDTPYRAVFDHARDAMLLVDDDARFVDANPAACALLRYSREELMAMTIWEVTPRGTLAEGRRLWEAFIDRGQLSGEYSMVRKDGTVVPVEFSSVANVRPGLHLTINRDVSERHRHSELLGASEQKYQTLLAHAPLVLFVVDTAGRFTMSEGRGLQAVGLEPGEVVGQSAYDLYGAIEIVEQSGRRTNGSDVITRVLAGETVVGTTDLNGRCFENTFLPMRNASGGSDGMMAVSYDVTALQRAAEALRANEEHFRHVVENISDVITVLDERGTILYESPSLYPVLGYQPAELVGRNAFDLVHPDDLASVQAAFSATRTDIAVRSFRFRHRDGSWRTLEAAGKARVGEDGTRTAVIASRDLTASARGHAESRLLQDVTWRVARAADIEEALSGVMDLACHTPDWVFAETWVVSDDGARLEQSVWYSAEPQFAGLRDDREHTRIAPGAGLPGKAWAENRAIWLADVTEAESFLRRGSARAAGLHAALAVPITRDDRGTVAAVLILYSADVRAEDTRLVGLYSAVAAQLGAAMQRQHAKIALHSSQVVLQSVVTRAPIVVFALDRNGVFTSSEGKGLEELGLKPGEVVGLSVSEVYQDLPEFDGYLKRALAGETFTGATEVNGRFFETWYSPRLDASGAITGVLGVATDLTERRQLEEQLRQAQKLESVGLLAGGIAHDFNNMLTAISGYAALILDDLPPDTRLRDDVGEIIRAADKAALLTYQLLAFSRKQILRPETMSLNDVVADVSRMLRRVIGEDIALVVRHGEALGMVSADPGQLAQVIMNLSVNARDAMPNGGTLVIETANVELDGDHTAADPSLPRGSYVVLAVSDTGTGMTPEVRDRIFEPFFTTKDVGKGTGMGLSTVYGIVKQSGGHVSVHTEAGEGTTFRVFLPRVRETGAPHAEPAGEGAFARGNETVLLVEDEDVVRRLARRALESCGYNVLEAEDGAQALALARSHAAEIEILITDVVMPRMSGGELVEQLACLRPDLKILYISGYTDDAIVHRGVLNQGTSFLQKPFSMRTLSQKVRDILDAR